LPGTVAGANIVAGGNASIRAIVNALSIAATALINSHNPNAVAIPSLAITKNGATTLILGELSDDIVASASASGTLYGAYSNAVSASGVSAIFNGVIIPASLLTPNAPFSGFSSNEPPPSVVSNDGTVRIVNPDNFTFKPTTVVFVGSATALSLDEAVTKYSSPMSTLC
jgi:hypothetical protein